MWLPVEFFRSMSQPVSVKQEVHDAYESAPTTKHTIQLDLQPAWQQNNCETQAAVLAVLPTTFVSEVNNWLTLWRPLVS